MKVLHVPYCYYPDAIGGTEIYVESLARFQRELGIEVVVAAPGPKDVSYPHDGHPVYRFQTATAPSLPELYGRGDPQAARSFRGVLESVQPDVVHLHAFTSAVSIRVVRGTRESGIPVVFTYHTPTVSCTRGTLLRWGSELCEGVMETRACAQCRLQSNGMPKAVARMMGSLPTSVGNCAGKLGFSGSAWTALRTTELVSIRHSAARALFAEADRIVAVCEWGRELLVRNGVDPGKIELSRQGLSSLAYARIPKKAAGTAPALRMAFMGRLDVVKGLGVLIEALQLAPSLAVTLDIFAIVQGESGRRLMQALKLKSSHDRRISFQPPLVADQTVDRLREYDVLAVPSQWLETGPLVVYEAFAAGTPVIGSRRGGIAELVQHEKNGLLVETSSREAWAGAVSRLVEDRTLLPKLQRGIGPVRTMRDVASEMQPVYERVLAGARRQTQSAAL